MDRRLSAGGDSSRTPMAWRHRDQLYSQQQHQQGYHHGEVYSTGHGPYSGRGLGCRGGASSRLPRPASPPETSNSSSLSSESHAPPHHGPLGPGMSAAGSLSTWDGEPCPGLHYGPGMPPPGLPPPGVLMLPAGYAVGVHGLPQAMLMAPPPLPPPGPPPAILLPPMLRPRPLVFPAIPTTPTPPEPLPVREPKAALSLHPKEMMTPRGSIRCCRGGCVVLWIIVGLILSGALLATALRFVVP